MWKRALWLLLISTISPGVIAIIITPTVLDMEIQSGRMAQVVVTNNSTQQIPLEISVKKLEFLSNGEFVTRDNNEDNLVIFPPAAMVKPGKSQVFRLQWIGSKKLPQSESYFVRFSQPPLASANTDTSGISVQMHYNALIHVFSQNQAAEITLVVDEDGTAVITNSGDRFSYLSLIRFEGLQRKSADAIDRFLGERFIAPSTSFEFSLQTQVEPGEYYGQKQ